MDKQVFDEN